MLHCSMAAYWKCAKHPFKYLCICILSSCMVQTPKHQLCLHSDTWSISYADMFNIPGANDALTLHYSSVIMSMMVSQIISAAIVYTTVCSGVDQRKHWKLHVTGLCEGNSRVTGEFPAQRASSMENVSIWWCHHEFCFFSDTWFISYVDLLKIPGSNCFVYIYLCISLNVFIILSHDPSSLSLIYHPSLWQHFPNC